MPIDPIAAAVIEVMEQVFPKVDELNSAPDARAQMKAMPSLPEVEEVGHVDDRTIPGPAGDLPVRIFRPREAPTNQGSGRLPGVVYLHGGGWVICDLDSHDGACRRIANAIGAVVVSVDYRLAPEHRYPAAVDDAHAAAAWVADHADDLGIDSARLAVAGDSAGGNLAACIALMARDRGGPALAFQLLVYPVIDSTATANDHPSKTENATGYFLTTAQMDWYRAQYLPLDHDGNDPYLSPHVAESLAGLPPACIVTMEMDPLRDEGELYARLLADAGVPVVLHRAEGLFHGCFNMDAVLTGAKEAQGIAFAAMRKVMELE
ncbi:MAG TPA: alpha/beta hydrolase [Acidimicrobiia bacterium]|nr:alpha/beta hydrolase [Acidimicrobiia bacterium]